MIENIDFAENLTRYFFFHVMLWLFLGFYTLAENNFNKTNWAIKRDHEILIETLYRYYRYNIYIIYSEITYYVSFLNIIY